MKPVTQEDMFGCGVACVAFILEKSYADAKKRYFRGNDLKSVGLFCRDLVKALKKGGRGYDFKKVKGKIRFKVGDIVFVKRSKRFPAGHYLIKVKEGWMDPWMNFSVKEFDIKKAKSGLRKKLPGKAEWVVFTIDQVRK